MCKDFSDRMRLIGMTLDIQESSSNSLDIDRLTTGYCIYHELLNSYKSQLEIGEKIYTEYIESSERIVNSNQEIPFKQWEYGDKLIIRDAVMITDFIYQAATISFPYFTDETTFEEKRMEKTTSDMEAFWSHFQSSTEPQNNYRFD